MKMAGFQGAKGFPESYRAAPLRRPKSEGMLKAHSGTTRPRVHRTRSTSSIVGPTWGSKSNWLPAMIACLMLVWILWTIGTVVIPLEVALTHSENGHGEPQFINHQGTLSSQAGMRKDLEQKTLKDTGSVNRQAAPNQQAYLRADAPEGRHEGVKPSSDDPIVIKGINQARPMKHRFGDGESSVGMASIADKVKAARMRVAPKGQGGPRYAWRNTKNKAVPPPAQPVPSNGTLLLLENATWTLPGAGDPVQCVAWRQTGDCSPHGPREPQNDRACNETIPNGASGYCEIIDRRSNPAGEVSKAMEMHCDSYPPSYNGMKCSDAWEYTTYAERSLRYYPRKSLRTHPELLNPVGNTSSVSSERGIVFCVADSMMVSVYAAINVMRSKGCKLPIELWYFQDEMTSASDPIITKLVQQHHIILRPVMVPRFMLCHGQGHTGKCFNVKIHAVYHTSFESVLLLDTDNFVLRDPTYLFDSPEFRDTGAIFWPDFWSPSNTIFNVWNTSIVWELTGLPFVDMHEQESGQLLINRRRHMRALDILMFYAIPDNILYRYGPVYGDKDLFRLAWMTAGEPFHMIQHPPGWAGQHKDFVGFCGNTMVQYDPEGKMLFMHRNSFKLDASEKSRQKIWQDVVHWVGGENITYWAHTWIAKRRWRFLVGFCYGPQKPTPGYAGSPGPEFAGVLDLEEMLLFHANAAVDILGYVAPPPPPPSAPAAASEAQPPPDPVSPRSMSAIRYSHATGKTRALNSAAKAVSNANGGSHPSSANVAWQSLGTKVLGIKVPAGAQSSNLLGKKPQ